MGSFLCDNQIQKLAELDVFLPFVGEKQRTLDYGVKAISFGLSQAGYDIRLSPEELLVFNGANKANAILDPKLSDPTLCYAAPRVIDGSTFFILPPHSFGLGVSLELISMPDNVFAIAQGKSTYARCGLITNITPIEPGWSGHLTICLVNPTEFSIRIYANEGIAQVMLYRLDENADKPYTGPYQGQGARVRQAMV